MKKLIDILYIRLGPLVKWPDRGELVRTQPMEFRKSFGKYVVIIDCFEVFMNRPTNLKARDQTWSNYNWVVGFQIYILQKTVILENLLPDDIVLADGVFNIHHSAGLYCAVVKLPPFTQGKKQLTNLMWISLVNYLMSLLMLK